MVIMLFLVILLNAQNWNFSKHTVNAPGDTTWVWNNWFTAWSTENKTMNGITAYGTGKTISVSRSSAALPDYIYRIKLDKGTEGLDANGKPLYRAVGFPVSGKGTLNIVMTSGSSSAKGNVKLYHFNETNTPKTTLLTTFESPDMSVNKFETTTYEYSGGGGELIISSGSTTQGTNLLEITWTPDATSVRELKEPNVAYRLFNDVIVFENSVSARLYSIKGQLVSEIENMNEIQIKNVPDGVYVMKIIRLKDVFACKIILDRK